MLVNILTTMNRHRSQYLEYKKLDKYIFMIMFHTDDMSPTDNLFLHTND